MEMKIGEIKKEMIEKIKKRQSGGDIRDYSELTKTINNSFANGYNITYCCELIEFSKETIKSIEDQLQVQETEKVEFEEVDMKQAENYCKDLKKVEKEIDDQMMVLNRKLLIAFKQCNADIENSLKLQHKFAEMSKVSEFMTSKNDDLILIENSKCESIEYLTRFSCEEENNTLNKIMTIENNIHEENCKCEEINDLIVQEENLAKLVQEYEEEKFRSLDNEIENLDADFSEVEVLCNEKIKINNNIKTTLDDLNKKIQKEIEDEEVLVKNVQNMMYKCEMFKKKGVFSEEDIDDNIRELMASESYQKAMEEIKHLKSDKLQLMADIKLIKNQTDFLLNMLEEHKAAQFQKDEDIPRLQNELDNINQFIQKNQADLQSLKDTNEESNRAVVEYQLELELVSSEINEKILEYKNLVQEIESIQNEIDMAAQPATKKAKIERITRTILKNQPSDSQKNKSNVRTWLKELPPNFDNNNDSVSSSKTQDSKNTEKSSIETRVKKNSLTEKLSQYSIFRKEYNFEVPDPDDFDESQFDVSFSENNTSNEYWVDESFLSLEATDN